MSVSDCLSSMAGTDTSSGRHGPIVVKGVISGELIISVGPDISGKLIHLTVQKYRRQELSVSR